MNQRKRESEKERKTEGGRKEGRREGGKISKFQINYLTLYLKEPKATRRKEVVKIGTEMNNVENRKVIEKINETKTKGWFFDQN
jgi:hypothetical protein